MRKQKRFLFPHFLQPSGIYMVTLEISARPIVAARSGSKVSSVNLRRRLENKKKMDICRIYRT